MEKIIKLEKTEYTIKELEKIVADAKSEGLILVKIEWEESRGNDGILEEFTINKDAWEELKPYIINAEVSFGEIWGKHSDVYGTIEESEITVFSDKASVSEFLKENPSGHSYNHSFIINIYNNLECYDEEDLDDDQLVCKQLINKYFWKEVE